MPRDYFPPVTINFAPVQVVGIPGLSLIAIVVAIAVQFPEARTLLLSSLAAGALLAALLVVVRRRKPSGARMTHLSTPPARRSTHCRGAENGSVN